MQLVTFKLQEDIIKEIDGVLKPLRFSNRTEFIREAIRDKLKMIDKEQSLAEFKEYQGFAKNNVSKAEYERVRKTAVLEFAKKKGWKLD